MKSPRMSAHSLPTVHILMASFNGQAYVQEQLDSIASQSYVHWLIHVSDDGSTDETLRILEENKLRLETQNSAGVQQRQSQELHIYKGPQQGSTINFMRLVKIFYNEGAYRSGDLVAFADQDDVWMPQKLERAVQWHLQTLEHNTSKTRPMLYAAKPLVVDENLRLLRQPKAHKSQLSFAEALVENVLSGNTMVMNLELLALLSQLKDTNSVWHDWSAYLLSAGCSGLIHYDPRPCLYYRQHPKNVIGARMGPWAQLTRVKAIFIGRYKSWIQANLRGLVDVRRALSPTALAVINALEEVRREKHFWSRLYKLKSLTLKRQNPTMQLLLYLGLLMGRV